MIFTQKVFYNNSWKKSHSKIFYNRKSLVNNLNFQYPDCNKKDLQEMLVSAEKGLNENKVTSFKERSFLLKKVSREIYKNSKKLAMLEVLETGKKFEDALNEIIYSSKLWLYASKISKSLNKKKLLDSNHSGYINFEPVGIVSLIVPWNFPFIVISERLPFILAAGNSVIIKPSEYASQSIIFLVKILKSCGFKSGIINLIFGSGNKVGKQLVKDHKVSMVSFTGSTAVGKQIMLSCSNSIKRLSLELGGKNPIIILSDANINKSVDITIKSFLANAGQACVATSKLFVHKSIKDIFIQKLIMKLNTFKNFKNIYGPISTDQQMKKIKNILNKNAKYKKYIIYGDINFNDDNFLNPIIFNDLPHNSSLLIEEIFGPVLTINSFDNIEEAIKISNSTKYGLSAVICGQNKKKNLYLASQLQAGRIWINDSISKNYPNLPIGGYKESGLNRECGEEGIKTYSEIKSIIIKN